MKTDADTDLDPRDELDRLRARLDALAAAVIALAPAPAEVADGDPSILWHVASASMARQTVAYLDGIEEQLVHLDHALDLADPRPDAVVIDLAAVRAARAATTATFSTAHGESRSD
jgi:hypothetical protein